MSREGGEIRLQRATAAVNRLIAGAQVSMDSARNHFACGRGYCAVRDVREALKILADADSVLTLLAELADVDGLGSGDWGCAGKGGL